MWRTVGKRRQLTNVPALVGETGGKDFVVAPSRRLGCSAHRFDPGAFEYRDRSARPHHAPMFRSQCGSDAV